MARVSPGRHARSGILAVALGALAALAPAAGAAAHGAGPPVPDAAYYRTELAAGQSLPAGVTARVDPAGEWIELISTAPTEIIVLGYGGEPYLRLLAGTVEENQLSPSTYLNRSLFADSLPTGGTAGLAPAWHRIGADGVARWHDHRIHWMGQNRPPEVRRDPTHAHLVGTWTVHATAAGTPFAVTGSLRWIGRPDATRSMPPWLWGLEGLIAGLLAAVTVYSARRRRAAPAEAEVEADDDRLPV